MQLNPFNGKCIHGVSGARLVKGVLRSEDCPFCNPKDNSVKEDELFIKEDNS